MNTRSDNTPVSQNDKTEQELPAFQVIDKRHFLDLDKVESQANVEDKPRYPTFVEELMGRLELTEKRFEERKAQMQEEISRTKARLEADFQRRVGLEQQKILTPFLEVLDNLERALSINTASGDNDGLRKGIEMITDLLRSKLRAQGVEAIVVLNQAFDPNLSQAVGVVIVADSSRDGVVVDEVQRGYRIGDQLLRPAQVRVGQLQQ